MSNDKNSKQPLQKDQEITPSPLKKGAEIPTIQRKPSKQDSNSQSNSNNTADSNSDKE